MTQCGGDGLVADRWSPGWTAWTAPVLDVGERGRSHGKVTASELDELHRLRKLSRSRSGTFDCPDGMVRSVFSEARTAAESNAAFCGQGEERAAVPTRAAASHGRRSSVPG